MATSGSLTTTKYHSFWLVFSWSRSSLSTENNTSTISWTLKAATTVEGYIKAGGFNVVIDGDTVYSVAESDRIRIYDGTLIASGTKVLTHDVNGDRSFSASVSAGLYEHATNVSGSGTYTLENIPRASQLLATNGTLGTAQTLLVDRNSTSFTHTITYECGSASGTVCTKSSADSISFTPPLSLASENTAGENVVIVYTIQTYSGNTIIGTATKTVYCFIPRYICPSATITTDDAEGHLARYGAYIKGLSKVTVTVTATPAYGSPIASYSTEANGDKYTDAEFTTAALKASGTVQITSTVYDKRGRGTVETVDLNVWDYAAPAISKLTVHRCDSSGTENDQGAYVKATFSASVSALNNINTASYVLRYKKPSDGDYTGVALDDIENEYSVTDRSYIFEADTGSSYDVEVTVEDNHYGATRSTSASTAFTLLNFKADGTGFAVGKVAERSNAMETDLDVYAERDLQVFGAFRTSGASYDSYGTLRGNGLCAYTGSGTGAIDPDTTLEHLCLTNTGVPMSGFMYVMTFFYNMKSATRNRAQFALPYNSTGSMYHRFYSGGAWSNWRRIYNEDENDPKAVTNQITGTPSTNCSAVSINYAARMGNVVQIRATLTAASVLAAGANIDASLTYTDTTLTPTDAIPGSCFGAVPVYGTRLSSTGIRCRVAESAASGSTFEVAFTYICKGG